MNKKKLDTVIFDLDGTLLNTLDDLAAALDYALGAFGMQSLETERVRRYVGNGVPKLIERALHYLATGRDPDSEGELVCDGRQLNACLAVFTEYYDGHSMDLTAPYAGVSDMLATLSELGISTAIVTNKYDAAAKSLAAEFFPTVNAVVGARRGIATKPAPDGVYKALELLGREKSGAIYVGDGETDMLTAAACGMRVVAVTWGFRDREVLSAFDPDYIVDTPDELCELLTALNIGNADCGR